MQWKGTIGPILLGFSVLILILVVLKVSYKPVKEGFQATSTPVAPATNLATIARRGTFIKSAGTGDGVFWKPLNQQIRQPVTSCTLCTGTNVCDFVKTVSNTAMNSLTASTAFTCDLLTATPPTLNPQGVGFFFKKPNDSTVFFKRFTENAKYTVSVSDLCFDIYPNMHALAGEIPADYVDSIPTSSTPFSCSFLTEVPIPAAKSYINPEKPSDIRATVAFNAELDTYAAYQEYEDELVPPEVDPPEAPLPEFPALTEFDPGAIPWDADNKDVAKEEILWGFVPAGASASIYNKAYHTALLSNPANLIQDGNAVKYLSPTFQVPTESKSAQAALELGEAVTMQAAPILVMSSAGYAAPYVASAVGAIKQNAQVALQNASTRISTVGGHLKSLVGKRRLAGISSKRAGSAIGNLARRLGLARLKSVPLAAIPVVGQVLFGVLEAIMTVASILLPPIMEQFMYAEGVCPLGYDALDSKLPQYASMILAFIPVFGDLLDIFYPYACFNSNATMKLKELVIEPPYYENTSWSMYFRTKTQISNTYRPPNNPNDMPYAWCDYSSEVMLNRMAQFYYDYAFANPLPGEKEDTISVSYISKILAVNASSEFSCDILCEMTTIEFNPMTNEQFKQTLSRGEDGQGHDRRFYFYKRLADPAASPPVAGDPPRVFTVTGCTHEDGTGPDAYNGVSLPATFSVTMKPTNPNASDTAKNVLLGIGTNLAAMSIVGTAGTIALEKTGTMDNIRLAAGLGDKSGGNLNPYYFDKLGNQVNDFENYIINVGLPVTQAIGTIPKITFCSRASSLTDAQCADSRFLKTAIDMYHKDTNNTRIRVKEVQQIEARGVGGGTNGCYYKWVEASYDPATNIETSPTIQERFLRYKIPDYRTCVWAPDRFVPYSATTYPARILRDVSGNTIQRARSFPRRPFKVPAPLPPEVTLSGDVCPTVTCASKQQLERIITQFNTQNPQRKILKVMRVATPRINRCDLDVEMLRVGTSSEPRIGYRDRISVLIKSAPSTEGRCVFDYVSDGSSAPNSGRFIQDNTPPLLEDVSGGVGFANSFLQSLRNRYNAVLASFIPLKASEKTQTESDRARTITATAFEQVYASQTLDGCPSKKCSDPDILKAIMTQYNIENKPVGQFGVQKQTMTRILKAGIANAFECDILFANQIESFDDILYTPIETKTVARAMRFTLNHTGNCKYTIVPNSAYDVSGSAIGLRSDSTTLETQFTGPSCQVDCRSPANIKAVAEQYGTSTSTGSIKQFVRTYQKDPTTCEYKFTKDYTTVEDGETITLPDTASYLTAQFTMAGGDACGSTLKSVQEVFPNDIEYDEEDEEKVYVKGKAVELPLLLAYELQEKPSPYVNTTPVSRPF